MEMQDLENLDLQVFGSLVRDCHKKALLEAEDEPTDLPGQGKTCMEDVLSLQFGALRAAVEPEAKRNAFLKDRLADIARHGEGLAVRAPG